MSNFLENSESQNRQYIDAESVFREFHRVKKDSKQTRGSMIWREVEGRKYLIRTGPRSNQKSLGPQSPETELIYERFITRKNELAERLDSIKRTFNEQKRLNKALRVGRAPKLLIDVLNALEAAELSDHFTVVGTHALYAYESACGVRFLPQAMATRDIDLLFDTRRHLAFVSKMKASDASFMRILQKVDKSFTRLEEKKETAINSSGFEIDVIRRVVKDADPHSFKLSDDEDNVWAVQADMAEKLLNVPRFSQMVVSTNGDMALMHTVHPLSFAHIKKQLAALHTREKLKISKDLLQARLVEELVETYMPTMLETDREPLSPSQRQ